MIKEPPFPIPFSVINSEIHITRTEPAVNTTIELMKNIIGLTFGNTAPGRWCKYSMKINDWNTAKTTVKTLVYCDNFLLPASPSSFCNFSNDGITTETSWIIIDEVI